MWTDCIKTIAREVRIWFGTNIKINKWRKIKQQPRYKIKKSWRGRLVGTFNRKSYAKFVDQLGNKKTAVYYELYQEPDIVKEKILLLKIAGTFPE